MPRHNTDTLKDNLLLAISRLEHRLAETEVEARACRTAIAELQAESKGSVEQLPLLYSAMA
jgi:hypothetical protein